VPKLNKTVIREWLIAHNWSIARLAKECNALGMGYFTTETMRNVVNGIDPMAHNRIRVICRVTARYGDGITYNRLVADTKQTIKIR
jgi:hypothetical protein